MNWVIHRVTYTKINNTQHKHVTEDTSSTPIITSSRLKIIITGTAVVIIILINNTVILLILCLAIGSGMVHTTLGVMIPDRVGSVPVSPINSDGKRLAATRTRKVLQVLRSRRCCSATMLPHTLNSLGSGVQAQGSQLHVIARAPGTHRRSPKRHKPATRCHASGRTPQPGRTCGEGGSQFSQAN